MSDQLPLNVIKAGEEADRLFEQMMKESGSEGDPGNTGNEPAPVITPDPVTPPAPAPPKPTPEPTPPPVTPAPPEDFKHKYDVLQGKYNAEVPLLHSENARLRAELASKPPPVTPAPVQPAPSPTKLTESLKEDPGVKFLETEFPDVWKPISNVIDTLANTTTQAINQLSSKVDSFTARSIKSEKDKFYDALDNTVKDWETIQATPEFAAWASKTDRYTGISRGSLLKDASENLDASRACAFFEDFVKETSTPAPGPGPVMSTPPPVAPAPARKVVAPPASAGNTPPRIDGGAPPEIIKASEIQAFYTKVQRGRFQGTQADQDAMEAKFGKAVAEGRVDPNS